MGSTSINDKPDELESGKRLGNYEIVSILGAGGMGVVYLAKQVFLHSEAVIKVLNRELSGNLEIIQRFFNEARAATEIQHPGIVKVFDFGYAEDKSAYIVMEYLRGESLNGRIKRVGYFAFGDALILTRQIASALSAAHKVGIVHRDLKPDNIFVAPDPEVAGGERIKLLDFGIAKLTKNQTTASQTRTGALMGTPAYMSPEQCTGASKVDHRTDLYALGCILFQMLCGQPPFARHGAGAVMAAHIYEPPPSPSALRSMPTELEHLILGLLAKAPDERFQNAESVMAAIDGLSTISGTVGSMNRVSPALRPETHPVPVPATPTVARTGTGARSPTTIRGAAGQTADVGFPSKPRILRYAALGGALSMAGALAIVLSSGEDVHSPPTTPLAASAPTEPASGTSMPETQIGPATTLAKAGTGTPGTDSEVQAPVRVRIESTPSGADVYRKFDGLRVGSTPLDLEWPASKGEFLYVLKLDGHRDEDLAVAADRSHQYMAELDRDEKPAASQRRRRNSGPEPGRVVGPASPTPSEQAPSQDPANTGPLDPFAQ